MLIDLLKFFVFCLLDLLEKLLDLNVVKFDRDCGILKSRFGDVLFILFLNFYRRCGVFVVFFGGGKFMYILFVLVFIMI